MKEKKKVSDFLINEKVPLFEKHNFPILETTEGDVVWLCGQRIDDRFKITRRTKQVLRLEYSREIVTSGKNPSR
jgi:tRNA(Ile)-lysidine synthase